jgi:hypothetical protein
VDINRPLASRVRAENAEGLQENWSPVCENPYKMEEPVASNYSLTSITIGWAAVTDSLSGSEDVL